MYDINLKNIANGFYNFILNKEEELYKERIEICRKCKLFKNDKILGDVCNEKLYLNPDTDKISKIELPGYGKGCGCVLEAKCRVRNARCSVNKW